MLFSPAAAFAGRRLQPAFHAAESAPGARGRGGTTGTGAAGVPRRRDGAKTSGATGSGAGSRRGSGGAATGRDGPRRAAAFFSDADASSSADVPDVRSIVSRASADRV